MSVNRYSVPIPHAYTFGCADQKFGSMTTLQQTVVKTFLADLASNKSLDDAKIEALRKLLAENPKVKADDLVKIFSSDGGDVT